MSAFGVKTMSNPFFCLIACLFNPKMLIFTNKYVFKVKKNSILSLSLLLMLSCTGQADGNKGADSKLKAQTAVQEDRLQTASVNQSVHEVPVDSMDMKNPFVMYDAALNTYYMTGDGGLMWTSNDMRVWKGPYSMIEPGEDAWMGAEPTVLSPEIYCRDDKYCLMASFGYNDGGKEVQQCAVLVADNIAGPYRLPEKSEPLTAPDEYAAHPAYAPDGNGNTCMMYTAGSSGNEIRIMMLADGQNTRMGEPFGIMDVSRLPWKGGAVESPEFLVTEEGGYAMLFASTVGGESVIAVAYSAMELGHPLNGPWIVEERPFAAGNIGGVSTFVDYDGTDVLVAHKEITVNGRKRYVPQFLKIDTQFEKLVNKGSYNF